MGSLAERDNILIALNAESVGIHAGELIDQGVIIFDDKIHTSTPLGVHTNLNLFPVPMEKLAVEAGQNKILVNAVATGLLRPDGVRPQRPG